MTQPASNNECKRTRFAQGWQTEERLNDAEFVELGSQEVHRSGADAACETECS
jgi:hypothetical protein